MPASHWVLVYFAAVFAVLPHCGNAWWARPTSSTETLTCQDEGYNTSYARYVGDERCYVFGERGPCNENMTLSEYNADADAYTCACTRRTKRPYVLWPSDNTCYMLHSKGPCRNGQWVTYVNKTIPSCVATPCATEDSSINDQLFFVHNNTCYCADDTPHRNGTQVDCGSVERGSDACPEAYPVLKLVWPSYFACSNGTWRGYATAAGQNLRTGGDNGQLEVKCDAGTYDPFANECVLM